MVKVADDHSYLLHSATSKTTMSFLLSAESIEERERVIFRVFQVKIRDEIFCPTTRFWFRDASENFQKKRISFFTIDLH